MVQAVSGDLLRKEIQESCSACQSRCLCRWSDPEKVGDCCQPDGTGTGLAYALNTITNGSREQKTFFLESEEEASTFFPGNGTYLTSVLFLYYRKIMAKIKNPPPKREKIGIVRCDLPHYLVNGKTSCETPLVGFSSQLREELVGDVEECAQRFTNRRSNRRNPIKNPFSFFLNFFIKKIT